MNFKQARFLALSFTCALFVSPTAHAKFFGTMAVSPQEFLGCQGRNKDPKCHPTISVGCLTLCDKTLESTPSIEKACKTLCANPQTLISIQKVSQGRLQPQSASTDDKKK